jgi:hypothetical protein
MVPMKSFTEPDRARRLAGRRGPGRRYPDRCRIATFGRLFEGTDASSSGQTWSSPAPAPADEFTHVTPATRGRIARLPISMNHIAILQNSWHSHGKLLASGNAAPLASGPGQ